jgi:glycerol-3-phosphate acyltransferase PlsY
MKDLLIVTAVGYSLGMLQSAFILGKVFKKTDIRTLGQGNSGASNATESFGWRFGFFVALFDILKGIVAVIIVKNMYSVNMEFGEIGILYLAGYSTILGHNFPLYMNFRGGKGTATLVGLLFGLSPVIGLIGALVILTASLISDYIVLGTFALLLYSVFIPIFLGHGTSSILLAVLGALLSLWLHRKNIVRLLVAEERRISSVFTHLKRYRKLGEEHE